jgi:alkylation response protein AidB-like acyl-CoA dehydrogenase
LHILRAATGLWQISKSDTFDLDDGQVLSAFEEFEFTLTFVPERSAIHMRGLAQGIECFALGRVSILGLALVACRR